MKKFLLSTVIGTTLMSTVTGGSLAFAEQKEQNVKVSYESIPEIATAEYMVVIPPTIDFKTDNAGVDLKIDLLNTDGEVYKGQKGVKISIESEHDFKLNSGNENLPYTLTYDGDTFSSDKSDSKISLNAQKPSSKGIAKIKTTGSIKIGKYSDTLTYTVESVEGGV